MTKPAPQVNPAVCISCGAPIVKGASICGSCKDYQRPWRNELKYWAGITGLLALIGSGAGFTFTFWKELQEFYFPAKPEVSELNTFGLLSVMNVSAQNVWLESLSITSTRPSHDLRWEVRQVIKPREIANVKIFEMSKEQFSGISADLFGVVHGPYVFATLSSSDVVGSSGQKNRVDAKVIDEVRTDLHRDRYVTVFLKRGGGEQLQIARVLKERAVEVPCRAELSIMYAESQRRQVLEVPCLGYLKNRNSSKKIP